MKEADIILLPYDPSIYRSGTSGVFVEAIIAGKIPVVKEGSWLSYELKRFSLEELVIDWEKKNLYEYFCSLPKNKEVLQKLEKMRIEYRKFHSIRTYQKQIEELLFVHTCNSSSRIVSP